MLSPNSHRALIRALSTLSCCLIVFAFASWFAMTQRAKNQSRKTHVDVASTSALVLDEHGLAPAAATIAVNSTSYIANSTDGLCTLREAAPDTSSG